MEHYAHAPITEAVIDLRVKPPEGVTVEALGELHEGEREKFPEKRKLFFVHTHMEAGERFTTKADQTERGWAFVTGDKLNVWQLHVDGFTFSRLAPYTAWEPFRDEARRLWQIFQRRFRPAVTRVGIRYINRLDLPLPFADFKEYLRTVPEVSPDVSQALSGYLMQLLIPQPDINAKLILNQALVEPARPGVASVVLDLDLAMDKDLPNTDEAIWELFEKLRTRRTEVFEGCITERMREMIR